MTLWMLDTNIVGHLVNRHPSVTRRMLSVPMESVRVSAITEGELRFGLAKRPEATRLRRAIDEFLRRVDVLPWDSAAAARYGALRAATSRQGKTFGSLDLLIAAHALTAGAVLVTNDRAFRMLDGLSVEDWTQPI